MEEKIVKILLTKYNKKIWNEFVKGIKTYELIEENDKIFFIVKSFKDLIIAECLFEYRKHKKGIFDIDFYGEKIKFEKYKKIMNIDMKQIDDLNINLYNKQILGDMYEDASKKILKGILEEGKFSTILPIKEKENLIQIIPFYYVSKEFINKVLYDFEIKEDVEEENIDKIIKYLKDINPGVEKNIFNSASKVNLSTIISYNEDGKEHNFLDNYNNRDNNIF